MDVHALLGDEAESLLTHTSKGVPKEDLVLPGPYPEGATKNVQSVASEDKEETR